MDERDDETNQRTGGMTAFVDGLLQQMQNRFQSMSDSITIMIDEMGGRIAEVEQSIGELRSEIGADGSPSPSAAAKPNAEETKDDTTSA